MVIDNDALRDHLEHAVEAAYAERGIELSPQFVAALVQAGRQSRGFASARKYTLEQYGLSESTIEWRFDAVYRNRILGRGKGRAANA